MTYNISRHAMQQFALRQIDLQLVEIVMNFPENILIEDQCMHIYQRKFKVNDKNYLYRMFVNVCSEPALIITGYRTSKIEKYDDKIR